MELSWDMCREDFVPEGALRDIRVVDATASDWQAVLGFLESNKPQTRYTVDGVLTDLPNKISLILATRASASPLLLFKWGDIDIVTHFFAEDDLEFDFRPEEVQSQRQLDQLGSFINGVGRLLQKKILICCEGLGASPFLIFDPEIDSLRYLPPGA